MTITKSWVPTRSPDPRVSVFRFRDEGTGNLLSPLAPLLDCKAPPGGVISQDVLHRHILTQTHTRTHLEASFHFDTERSHFTSAFGGESILLHRKGQLFYIVASFYF